MQQPSNATNQGKSQIRTSQKDFISDVAKYTQEERSRWKRTILNLIYVGVVVSILIHLIMGFLLQISSGTIGDGSSPLVSTKIDFAILDEEQLQDMPDGKVAEPVEEVQTEAAFEVEVATTALLASADSRPILESTSQSQARSLSGGGSSGMGAGVGGSGGGGASFFGIASSGNRFCYIVDISGSMNNSNRLALALEELSASLKNLPDFARFNILFYHSFVVEPPSQRGWNRARRSVVRRMVRDFQAITPTGGTHPILAFEMAFALDPLPEVIFFLTDGDSLGFKLNQLIQMIPSKSPIVINTIAFGNNSTQQLLRDIANATRGKYTFVKTGTAP